MNFSSLRVYILSQYFNTGPAVEPFLALSPLSDLSFFLSYSLFLAPPFFTGLNARILSYGVCDTPQWFYDHTSHILSDLGAGPASPALSGRTAADLFVAKQAKGVGYALSTEEELKFTLDVARATGVLLDPVYSGKALYQLLEEMRAAPAEWRGRTVLFWHTGGLLGMYDKERELAPLVADYEGGRVQRMEV
jgi:D-cysteine desulfhydrase